MKQHPQPTISGYQAAAYAVLFLSVATYLAAAAAVLIMQTAGSFGGALGAYLIEAGAGKVMRRCLLAFALVFLLLFLWRGGWRGWKDCGFTTNDPDWSWRPWHIGLRNGLILGIFSMSSVGLLTILAGIHHLHFTLSAAALLKKTVFILLAGLAVGFFEETVMRGMLFRVLARIWRAWPAAVLSSLVFAAAHFGEPPGTAFSGTSFLETTLSVFVSTFASVWDPRLTMQFINLTLLGIVLSAFVLRTKTIWLSIGAHAAWVWMIKLHELVTIFYPAAPLANLLGKRNDFMDSPLATVMLSGLLAWTATRGANSGQRLSFHQRTWHVLPSAVGRFKNWLEALSSTKTPPQGRILKAYPGCRVTALRGMVWKEYYPVAGSRGWRFRLLPSRTRRAFQIGRRLIEHGIPTPQPIAWSSTRCCGLRLSDHGITEELDSVEPLTAWLERQVRDPAQRGEGVMRAYGSLMASFHRAGFSNRDLKHENVLCATAEPSRLWVVDLDGVRWRPWITRTRAGRDLRRVGLSLAALGWGVGHELAAFFEAYNAQVPRRLWRNSFPV